MAEIVVYSTAPQPNLLPILKSVAQEPVDFGHTSFKHIHKHARLATRVSSLLDDVCDDRVKAIVIAVTIETEANFHKLLTKLPSTRAFSFQLVILDSLGSKTKSKMRLKSRLSKKLEERFPNAQIESMYRMPDDDDDAIWRGIHTWASEQALSIWDRFWALLKPAQHTSQPHKVHFDSSQFNPSLKMPARVHVQHPDNQCEPSDIHKIAASRAQRSHRRHGASNIKRQAMLPNNRWPPPGLPPTLPLPLVPSEQHITWNQYHDS